MLLAALAVGMAAILGIYPFLAVNVPGNTKTLVVEGWMGHPELVQVVNEFRRGGYERVFTVGGPVHGMKQYANDYSTNAYIAAQSLVQLGLQPDAVQSVPSHVNARDRTYSAAVALRDWLAGHKLSVPEFTVVTEGPHARRSRLLFDEAFAGRARVGVMAIPNVDYDGAHWWRYSEGVKDVVSEAAAYLYARLLFHPSQAESASNG